MTTRGGRRNERGMEEGELCALTPVAFAFPSCVGAWKFRPWAGPLLLLVVLLQYFPETTTPFAYNFHGMLRTLKGGVCRVKYTE